MGNPMLKPLDPFRFLLIAVAGRMNQHQLQVIDYLREENRVLREQLGGRRLRLRDDRRRRLAAKAKAAGWRILARWLHLHAGNSARLASEADRTENTMALAGASVAGREPQRKSKRWWSGWHRRTAIVAFGEAWKRRD